MRCPASSNYSLRGSRCRAESWARRAVLDARGDSLTLPLAATLISDLGLSAGVAREHRRFEKLRKKSPSEEWLVAGWEPHSGAALQFENRLTHAREQLPILILRGLFQKHPVIA